MGIGYKALWGEYVGVNGTSHSNIYGSNLAIVILLILVVIQQDLVVVHI